MLPSIIRVSMGCLILYMIGWFDNRKPFKGFHDQLKQVIQRLATLTLEERRQVAGLNPERADIIISDAAVLDTFMTELGIAKLQISRRSLRDGLVIDYFAQAQPFEPGIITTGDRFLTTPSFLIDDHRIW
jgi:exopolyphosphatase/pppGpp-phosphohydrolase